MGFIIKNGKKIKIKLKMFPSTTVLFNQSFFFCYEMLRLKIWCVHGVQKQQFSQYTKKYIFYIQMNA